MQKKELRGKLPRINYPASKVECKRCGILFYSRSNRTPHCGACRAIVCRWCGTVFIPKNGQYKTKYCSKRCFENTKVGDYPPNLNGRRGTKPRTYHLRKRELYGNAFDREWRTAVFERDDYTCQECNIRGGRLQAHHIKPYREHPEIRHDLGNGETLCVDCHKKTESYGWSKYWHNR